MANWAVDLDTTIYTYIQYALEKAFRAKYPTMLITSSDRTPTVAQFPAIYIHSLSGVESGITTEGNDLNAVLYTLQAEVTVTENQKQAKTIMAEITNIAKIMMFKVIAMPETTSTEDTYVSVARFRRAIGAGDIIPSPI